MKRGLLAVLVIVLAFMLAGCGSSYSPPKARATVSITTTANHNRPHRTATLHVSWTGKLGSNCQWQIVTFVPKDWRPLGGNVIRGTLSGVDLKNPSTNDLDVKAYAFVPKGFHQSVSIRFSATHGRDFYGFVERICKDKLKGKGPFGRVKNKA